MRALVFGGRGGPDPGAPAVLASIAGGQARRHGLPPSPQDSLIADLASWSGGIVRPPWAGLPMTHPGAIDVVYDTVGAAATVEVGVRVLASRGTLVQLGVGRIERCEWTPWHDASTTLAHQSTTGAIKVAFDLRPTP